MTTPHTVTCVVPTRAASPKYDKVGVMPHRRQTKLTQRQAEVSLRKLKTVNGAHLPRVCIQQARNHG